MRSRSPAALSRRLREESGFLLDLDGNLVEDAVPRAGQAGQNAPHPDHLADPHPPRYVLPGGKVGLSSLPLALRTAVGAALLLGLPPLLGGALGRAGAYEALHRVERAWARATARWLNLRIDLEGLHHIDPRERYLVAPLHEGFADAVALLHLPLRLRFVARDEFVSWRLLGPYVQATGQLLICPERPYQAYRHLLKAAPRVFDEGDSLVLFPQGSILGIETDFLPGAFALACALARPLLPVVLTGSHRVWEYPFSTRLRYGQRVSVRVLPPLPAGAWQTRSVEEVRLDLRDRLKALALSPEMAPPRRYVPSRDGYWDGYVFRIDPTFASVAEDVAHHRRAAEPGQSGHGGPATL